MNRQITGTLALLMALAAAQLVSAQLQTPYGMVAMPAASNMMPPQGAGLPPGMYGTPPQGAMIGQPGMQMMMPSMAMPPGMSPGTMPPGMSPGTMPRGISAAGMHPAMAMRPPVPGPFPGQLMPGAMQPPIPGQAGLAPGYAVQPAMFAAPAPGQAAGGAVLQRVSHSSCDGCDSPGCDSCGCGGQGPFGGFSLGGMSLLGLGGCGDGCGGGLSGLAGGCQGCGLAGCGHAHGPDGTGGCCLPRWFDAHAEWLYWKRDYSQSLALSSEGILGPIVLNTDDVDFSYESGYRVTGAYIVGPSTGLELSYFGGLSWQGSSVATSDANLFSVFSDFGSDPLNGFPETAFGNLHSIAISSEMNNAEMNLRRRFVSASCQIHSSLLVGIRYFRLRDDLVYETFTGQGQMSYQLRTDNDLLGVQTGGDLYFCLTPRFKIGAEVKAGVYGTNSKQRTNVFCTSCEPLRERDSVNDAAFLGDAGAIALYRVTPRLTLRGGYQVLYVDGVATAVNNFNTASPFTARTSFVDNDGDAFVHGSNLGFEWTW